MKREEKTVIETFRDVGSYALGQLKQDEPSCFNGMVRVRRYRVTVELIDEPTEVIQERLRKMWSECTNHHHLAPLLAAGKEYGIDLRA